MLADDQVACSRGHQARDRAPWHARGRRGIERRRGRAGGARTSADVCIVAVELPEGRDRSHPPDQAVAPGHQDRDDGGHGARRGPARGVARRCRRLSADEHSGQSPAARDHSASCAARRPCPGDDRTSLLEFRDRGARRRVVWHSGRRRSSYTRASSRSWNACDSTRDRRDRLHLGISQVTVRRHVASVLRKLGVPNRRRAIEIIEQAEPADSRKPTSSAAKSSDSGCKRPAARR